VREIHDGSRSLIQLRNGPFDLDLVYAPDGIPSFAAAWRQHIEVDGFHVCHLDHIIRSKEAADRLKDRESLPRLRAFRTYWLREHLDQLPERSVQPEGSPQTVFWDALEQVREISERALRLGLDDRVLLLEVGNAMLEGPRSREPIVAEAGALLLEQTREVRVAAGARLAPERDRRALRSITSQFPLETLQELAAHFRERGIAAAAERFESAAQRVQALGLTRRGLGPGRGI